MNQTGLHFHNEILKLPACPGGPEAILSNAQGTCGIISPKFQRWDLQHTQDAAPARQVRAVDIKNPEMNFAKFLDITGNKYRHLALTQEQIKLFVQLHPSWVCNDGLGTLLLFKEILRKEERFFFAQVTSASLGVFQVKPLRLVDMEDSLVVRENSRITHVINHARLILPYHG